MRVKEHQRLPVLPARDPGSFLVLPLPLDLGGRPGTGSGAAWLGERLAECATASIVGASYTALPSLMCEVPFGRLEPSLYAAATTLQVWALGYRPFWLFGDHGLSFGPVRAAGAFGKPVTVFVFDAHFDRSDRLLSKLGMQCALENEVHQGNVSTWIGRDPAVRKLLQIGIRQKLTETELDAVPSAEIFSAESIRNDPEAVSERLESELAAAVEAGNAIVLSVDVDVLDPAVQPAVDHRISNGLSLAELVHFAAPIAQAACSVDFAELNPLRDDCGRGCNAALVAASALLSVATHETGRESWGGVLGSAERVVVAPIGPYTQTFADATHWFEPDAVEGAILDGYADGELYASFTADALRTAVENIRVVVGSRETPPSAVPERVALRLAPAAELRCPEPHVECADSSHDGALVAAAGWDHLVYLWRLDEGQAVPCALAGHSAWVVAMAFSPRDARLATVSDDGTLRIWNGEDTLAEPLVCAAHECWVKSVAWSPDARFVATGGFDGSLGVWDAATGEALLFRRAHDDTIWGLAWSPGGELLASCGERGEVRGWSPLTGELRAVCAGHAGSVERCRFTITSALWSLNRSGELMLHELRRARPTLRVSSPLRQATDMCVLRGSQQIVVAGETSVLIFAEDGQSARELEAGFPVAAVSELGDERIVIGGDGGVLAVYDLKAAPC